MTPNPIVIPRHKRRGPNKQEKVDPIRRLCGLPTSIFFASGAVLLVISYSWARRWLISGAPLLTFFILLGASKGYRVASFIHLWTLLTTLNLLYAVASTSWLLYGLFTTGCYPAIFLTCLIQFDTVADVVRSRLRSLLEHLQFVNDKIAFFNIPALEIDTDVEGLMVIRGITICLSTLTIIVHGVELGIKLSDDLELAIQTETVTISLFRTIYIGDVYGNIKGGEHEMTFHKLERRTHDADGAPVMLTGTPLLTAASLKGDTSKPKKIKMTEEMTDGRVIQDSSAKAGLKSVTRLSPNDETASKQYKETLRWIQETSSIQQCYKILKKTASRSKEDENFLDASKEKELRAAVCYELHKLPSVPHPPERSIRVTTLQNLSPDYVRNFLHRLPLLLRMLLLPLSYFHPISIASITASSSGKWIQAMIGDKVFQRLGEEDAEIARLEAKISGWLADASFTVEVADIFALAQVPVLTEFDIVCYLASGDVMAYRTVPEQVELRQVIRLGGADATFTLPSFLLPHHEHLLPAIPTRQDKRKLERKIAHADDKPETVQANNKLEQAENDEANVKMSVHARLPAEFDQELLDFVAALVKATKVVEMEKEPSAMEDDISSFTEFRRNLQKATKEGMKKAMVGGMVNDKWIAKMVGKITRRLETAQGDVGYSGDIPVALGPYRPKEGVRLASKLLP